MSIDSLSFIYKTPEQRRQRSVDAVNSIDSEEWFLLNDLSFIRSPGVQSDEQDESVANSHFFQRRNRLETRLEELQKDMDCLALNLRAKSGSRLMSDVSRCLEMSKEQKNELETTSIKTSAIMEKRRNGTKEQLVETTTAGNSTIKTLQELKHVTKERDQLKLHLKNTNRVLAAVEKKCEDAAKKGKAYDKLKARCDSLQKSLELSEKIRVRQKKLLERLQVQQQEKNAKKEKKRYI